MPKTEIKVSDDNIHVKDSYLYNKREIKSTVDEFYKSFPAMCCHSNRSKYSLRAEWYVHNFLYALNIERDIVSSVDLNYPRKRWVELAYEIAGPFCYLFIK